MKENILAKDRLIVALDNIVSFKQFEKLVKQLSPYVWGFKIGLEIINNTDCKKYLEYLNKNKLKIFYDIKLHDIPNTVGHAAKNIAAKKVHIMTVHASGGSEMLQAAIKNKNKTEIFAVTILTSIDNATAKNIFGKNTKAKVIEFAKLAAQNNVDGIICAATDLVFLKKEKVLKDLKFITPGIRPAWTEKGDQKRICTPTQAIRNGADKIVIGRPITGHPDPVKAVQLILEEIKHA